MKHRRASAGPEQPLEGKLHLFDRDYSLRIGRSIWSARIVRPSPPGLRSNEVCLRIQGDNVDRSLILGLDEVLRLTEASLRVMIAQLLEP